MTSTDPQPPWFSGFCLQGELAGQYELDEESAPETDEVPSEEEGGKARQLLKLDGLGPITIFVGANNSGKSRLMRGLFGDASLVSHLRVGVDQEPFEVGQKSSESELSILQKLAKEICGWDDPSIGDIVEIQKVLKGSHDPAGWTYANLVDVLDHALSEVKRFLGNNESSLARLPKSPGLRRNDVKPEEVMKARTTNEMLEEWARRYDLIRQESQPIRRIAEFFSLRRCYVPMLRGMRPPSFAESKDQQVEDFVDCYEKRTVQDYFHAFSNWKSSPKSKKLFGFESIRNDEERGFQYDPRIFTGLSLFADLKERLLAPTKKERESVGIYEKFLSEYFFRGQEVTLTPAINTKSGELNDVVHIKIGDMEDRPIYELGDGMQGLIICTYPIIAELQEGSLFFFEEPDLGT
jgi:hypothetical protein